MCIDFKFRSKNLNMLMKTMWDGYISWLHLCCFACIFYFYIFILFSYKCTRISTCFGLRCLVFFGFFIDQASMSSYCERVVAHSKSMCDEVSQCVMNGNCGHNWLLGNTLQFSFPHVMNFVTNLRIKLSLIVWLN